MKLRSRDLDLFPNLTPAKRRSLRVKLKMCPGNVNGQNILPAAVGKGVRADWDPFTTDIFCRWAAQAVDQNHVSGNHLTKAGWAYIHRGFTTETGLPYSLPMLKNKWRQLKNQYKEAKRLLGSMTGLGWDNVRGTVIADDEWWADRIQQNPAAATLRGKRLPNWLDMERMFVGVRDLSGFGWSPQMGGSPSIPNMNAATAVELGEDIGDTSTHEDCSATAFGPVQFRTGVNGHGRPRAAASPFPEHQYAAGPSYLPPRPQTGNMDPAGNGSSSGRKQKSDREERTAILSKISDYLTTGRQEQIRDIAGAIADPNDMGPVMQAVEELPGVEGDPFWFEAADFFMANEKAIGMFLRGCKSTSVRMQWLQKELAKWRG